jgi:hypothetical protein
MSAAHFKLSNLVVIVDNNGLQYDGVTQDVLDMGDLAAKWESFVWMALTVDGHDMAALLDALQTPHDKPLAIIARTASLHSLHRPAAAAFSSCMVKPRRRRECRICLMNDPWRNAAASASPYRAASFRWSIGKVT